MKKLGPEKKVRIIDVRLYTIQGAGATSETTSTETSCFWLIEVLFNQRSKPFKKYGPLSGLLTELKKIITSPKWANAWLEVEVDELDWYVVIRIFKKKKSDNN